MGAAGGLHPYPDRPYVIWTYTNGEGEKVIRNNPKDFVEASHELCKIFQRFVAGAPDANVPGLSNLRRDQIKEMVEGLTYPEGDKRHKNWLDAVKNDEFGFGAVELDYIPKGEGSWKYAALGTRAEIGDDDEYRYDPRFLNSNWKMFHDAAKAHRFAVINDILPRYSILAA